MMWLWLVLSTLATAAALIAGIGWMIEGKRFWPGAVLFGVGGAAGVTMLTVILVADLSRQRGECEAAGGALVDSTGLGYVCLDAREIRP